MKSYSPPSPSDPTESNESTESTESTDAVEEDGVVSYAPLIAMGLGVVLLGVYFGLPLVLMIVGVIAMITVHELGHFLTAKWSGMKVTEFFVGFGPRLWSFQRGETEYGIKAIPAGAYVRIIGMNNLDEVPAEDEARSYRQQSFPKRLLVVLAGPATHFIQAFLILFVLFAFVGVPGGSPLFDPDTQESRSWLVGTVTDGSAAAAAGLSEGDRIVEFDGQPVETWGEVSDLIGQHKIGDVVTLRYQRDAQDDGPIVEKSIELKRRPSDLPGDHDNAFLGVGATVASETYGFVESAGRSVSGTGEITWRSLAAMGQFVSPSGIGDYAHTVGNGSETPTPSSSTSHATTSDDNGASGRPLSILGVLRLGSDMGQQGLANLLVVFLMINVFVGMINLVPLLPFDGGHAAVAVGLVILGVTSLYLDIVNPI
jgi:membrane-associated protease RseP (regulator of RpoE activity)